MECGLREINSSNQMEIWSERVAACRASNMSVARWCKQEGINESSYYRWQRKLFQELQAADKICFTEIPTQQVSGNHTMATLRVGSVCVELYNGAAADLIRNLVEALQSC